MESGSARLNIQRSPVRLPEGAFSSDEAQMRSEVRGGQSGFDAAVVQSGSARLKVSRSRVRVLAWSFLLARLAEASKPVLQQVSTAQLVERLALSLMVVASNPTGAIFTKAAG